MLRQRRKPNRDAKHLQFIRSLPCCNCMSGGGSQAAHIRIGTDGGISIKPGDEYTLPLCFACHTAQHQRGERLFWSDMDRPHRLARNLYAVSGDLDKGLEAILEFKHV